jgi:hypothetical protein
MTSEPTGCPTPSSTETDSLSCFSGPLASKPVRVTTTQRFVGTRCRLARHHTLPVSAHEQGHGAG